jgi:hypothetical protein
MSDYIKNNMPSKATDLFHQIHAADELTFVLLFNACAQLATDQALSVIRMASTKLRPGF